MLCQKCGKNEATAHYKQNINGKKQELHLCAACAARESESIFGELPNLFGSLFGAPRHAGFPGAGKVCPRCGMTFDEIADTGMLGCSECYTVFAQELQPTLGRVHGKASHVGRIPKSAGGEIKLKAELHEAKAALKRAIEAQEFERAVELRDRIKDINERLGEAK